MGKYHSEQNSEPQVLETAVHEHLLSQLNWLLKSDLPSIAN